jgi:hypothetical protein
VENLESRRLLSAAAFQPMAATGVAVSAIIGPAVTSPIVPIVSASPGANMASQIQVGFGLEPIVPNAPAGSVVSQPIFIIEVSFSNGIGAAPSQPSANPTSGMQTGGTIAANGVTGQIAPLTPTVLAGSTARNRTPVIVIVEPQPLIANLGRSTSSAVTQAILLMAMLEEQPIQPPVLGQGFESSVGQDVESVPDGAVRGQLMPTRIKVEPPATDIIEPYQPADEQKAPPAEPGTPVDQPAAPAPPRNAAPVDTLQDAPLEVREQSDAARLRVAVPRLDTETTIETPTWSMATVVGTAAVVSGGYHLTLGGSNRFNQRWIPTRRKVRERRSRKV